jgi:hypothetical protein
MTKPPPVPKENRSPKGTGEDKSAPKNAGQTQQGERNLQEQGRQGNIKQNTTNQGYQQDR